MKKFICRNCGAVNEATQESSPSSHDWLQTELPLGFQWRMPAGKITPIGGQTEYISGLGKHLSHEAYLRKYNIDQEIACNLKRGCTTYPSGPLRSSEETAAADTIAQKARSQYWLDEDYWTA